MPIYSEPRCSQCGLLCSPELITKKMAVFFVGSGKQTRKLKERVTDWLCRKCRDADPHWLQETNKGPGHTSPARERLRRTE